VSPLDHADAVRIADRELAVERVRREERRRLLSKFHARWPFWAALLSTVLLALARAGGAA